MPTRSVTAATSTLADTSSAKLSFNKLKGITNYLEWTLQAQNEAERLGCEAGLTSTNIPADIDRRARTMLRQHMERKPLQLCKSCTTAKQIWDKCKANYQKFGFKTNFLLYRTLNSTKLSSFSSMEDYLNSIQEIADTLEANNQRLHQHHLMSHTLYNLNTDYDTFTSGIVSALRKDPDAYTFDTLCEALLDEARGKEGDEELALNLVSSSKQQKSKAYCSCCKKKGHKIDQCWFNNPELAPATWKSKQQPNKQPNIQPNKVVKNKSNKYTSKNNWKNKKEALLALISSLSESENSSPEPETINMVNIPVDSASILEEIPTDSTSLLEDISQSHRNLVEELSSDEEMEVYIPKIPKIPITISYTNNTTLDRLSVGNAVAMPKYKQQYRNNILMLKNHQVFHILEENTFILDSGATISTTCSRKYLINYIPIKKYVLWGNAKKLLVRGKGDMIVKYKDTQKIDIYKGTYYIPELGINLISIKQLKNKVVTFNNNQVLIQDNTGQTITRGKIGQNGLYTLDIQPASNIHIYTARNIAGNTARSIAKNTAKNTAKNIAGNTARNIATKSLRIIKNVEELIKWHKRLGHASTIPLIQFLRKQGYYIPYKIIQAREALKCKYCILAKPSKKANKKSLNNYKYKILERIHSDIGGPIAPITYNKYRYYITFLDKKSRYLKVKLLRTKDEALIAFQEFQKEAENSPINNKKRKILELFTDNGREYITKDFDLYLYKGGIKRLLAPPYNKEANGLIERINLTLLNKVRAVLYTANLPLYLWGEALLAQTHIYNITPHKALNYKAPWEEYNISKLPKNYLENIPIFGSICYYNTIKNTKLKPKKAEAVIIGYSSQGHKHYKLYDFQRSTTIWSRDVEILEGQFITDPDPMAIDNIPISRPENNNIPNIPDIQDIEDISTPSNISKSDHSKSNNHIAVEIPRKAANIIKNLKKSYILYRIQAYIMCTQ